MQSLMLVLKKLLLVLASVGTSYTDAQHRECEELDCHLQNYLKRLVVSHGLRHRSRPRLMVYQSDCTSFLCRAEITVAGGKGSAAIHRRGRILEEFLMERATYRALLHDDVVDQVILLKISRQLKAGKKGS